MAAHDADMDVADSKHGVRIHSVRLTLPKDTNPASAAFEALRLKFDGWVRTNCVSWTYQLEDPSKTLQNVHFQGYVRVEPKVRSEQLRVSLWVVCTGGTRDEYGLTHVSPASKAGQTELKKYCMKTVTRIAGPWHDSDGPVPIKVLDDTKFLAWQKRMNDWLATEPDNRSIIWITDLEGCSGKTVWAKYQFVKHNACVIRYGKANDMACLIAAHKNRRTYIFDLSRSKPAEFKMDDLYSLCEALSDGLITSGKFFPTTWAQNSAHVVVLANFPPGTGVMTGDRLIRVSLIGGELKKNFEKISKK